MLYKMKPIIWMLFLNDEQSYAYWSENYYWFKDTFPCLFGDIVVGKQVFYIP